MYFFLKKQLTKMLSMPFIHIQPNNMLIKKPEPNLTRLDNICPYRGVDKHSLRKCPLFFHKKRKISKSFYIDSTLAQQDQEGFCAAGIVAYTKFKNTTYLFMLKQTRADRTALNFAGGGRETISSYGVIRPESYKETAINEFIEEVGELIGPDHSMISKVKSRVEKSQVLWTGLTKFALIPVKVEPIYLNIDMLNNVSPNSEAIGFEWVDINSCSLSKIHNYTVDMFKVLIQEKNILLP